MKLTICLLAFMILFLFQEGKCFTRSFEKGIDSTSKLIQNLEINLLFSCAIIPSGKQMDTHLQFNSEFGYLKKHISFQREKLFELNYRIGYTKQDSIHWYRDDDLLRIRVKRNSQSKHLKFTLQASLETALTNALFPNQHNVFPREEFEGRSLFIPTKLSLGSGCQLNFSKSSFVNISISPANLTLAAKKYTIPETFRSLTGWKSNILLYEFGLILETEIYENLGKKLLWKFQSLSTAPVRQIKNAKVNAKNKLQYKFSPSVSLNLTSELEYNYLLAPKPLVRNTLLFGFLYLK